MYPLSFIFLIETKCMDKVTLRLLSVIKYCVSFFFIFLITEFTVWKLIAYDLA